MGSQAHSFLHSNMGWQFRIFLLAFLLSWTLVSCQDEGSGSGEAAEASGEEAGADAAEGSGDAAEAAADGSGDANGSGDAAAAEDCEEDGEGSGDGDIAGILAPKKCKNTDEMSGADALAEAIGGTPPQECSTDEKILEVPLNIAESISKLLAMVHVKTLDSEKLTNQEIQICVPRNIPVQLKRVRVSVPCAIVAKVLVATTLAVESTQEATSFMFWSMLTRLTPKLSLALPATIS